MLKNYIAGLLISLYTIMVIGLVSSNAVFPLTDDVMKDNPTLFVSALIFSLPPAFCAYYNFQKRYLIPFGRKVAAIPSYLSEKKNIIAIFMAIIVYLFFLIYAQNYEDLFENYKLEGVLIVVTFYYYIQTGYLAKGKERTGGSLSAYITTPLNVGENFLLVLRYFKDILEGKYGARYKFAHNMWTYIGAMMFFFLLLMSKNYSQGSPFVLFVGALLIFSFLLSDANRSFFEFTVITALVVWAACIYLIGTIPVIPDNFYLVSGISIFILAMVYNLRGITGFKFLNPWIWQDRPFDSQDLQLNPFVIVMLFGAIYSFLIAYKYGGTIFVLMGLFLLITVLFIMWLSNMRNILSELFFWILGMFLKLINIFVNFFNGAFFAISFATFPYWSVYLLIRFRIIDVELNVLNFLFITSVIEIVIASIFWIIKKIGGK